MNSRLSNIDKLYAYSFFHNLIFAYVIERLFALERGLNVQQMVYLEVIYAALVIGLEVPTGAISDRWSRKRVMILSAFFCFFEFFVLIFAHQFWMFILSATCAAVGGALASGTINAIFYDTLKQAGQESRFERVLAVNRVVDYAGATVAALSGAILAERVNLTFPYWLSLLGVGMAFGITLTLTEPEISSEHADLHYWEHIRSAFLFLKRRQTLQFVLLYGILIAAVWIYVDEYWQVYCAQLNVPISWFGGILVIFVLTSGLGGLCSSYIKATLNYSVVFSALLLLFTVTLFVLSRGRLLWGLGACVLIYLIQGALEPVVLGYLHHRTDSAHRATVESFYNLALRLLSILVGLAFGVVTTRTTIFGGYTFLALVALLYTCYFLPTQRRYLTRQPEITKEP